jgi:hypothetical protein
VAISSVNGNLYYSQSNNIKFLNKEIKWNALSSKII